MRIPALPPIMPAPSRRAFGLAVAALLVAGCVGAAGATPGISGSPETSGSPGSLSPDSSASPGAPDVSNPSPDSSDAAPTGFYLRAWRTQALAPWQTFGWLPSVTISDGQFIDGNIVVPAIYPGPVYLQPFSRSISAAGVQAIVDEARKDGLLSGQETFSEGAPAGGILAHLVIVVDGVRYDIMDPIPAGPAATPFAPGTAVAFDDFWNKITSLGQWLAADLGAASPFEPSQLAVLLGPPPAVGANEPIQPTQQPWPLATAMAGFGAPMGTQYRCGVVSGDDLARMLPLVEKANQLTIIVDSSGSKASLQARVLVPGEPSPCQ